MCCPAESGSIKKLTRCVSFLIMGAPFLIVNYTKKQLAISAGTTIDCNDLKSLIERIISLGWDLQDIEFVDFHETPPDDCWEAHVRKYFSDFTIVKWTNTVEGMATV